MDEEMVEGRCELEDFQWWQLDAFKGHSPDSEAENHGTSTDTRRGPCGGKPRLRSSVEWEENSDSDHMPRPRGQGGTQLYSHIPQTSQTPDHPERR